MAYNSAMDMVTLDAVASDDRNLPLVLGRDRTLHFHGLFLEEHQPVGPTEIAIVGDMARQAAAMERWGVASEAIERHAALRLPALEWTILPDVEAKDAVLAGAMSTEAAERSERQALGHSRAFYRACASSKSFRPAGKSGKPAMDRRALRRSPTKRPAKPISRTASAGANDRAAVARPTATILRTGRVGNAKTAIVKSGSGPARSWPGRRSP